MRNQVVFYMNLVPLLNIGGGLAIGFHERRTTLKRRPNCLKKVFPADSGSD